LKTLSFNEEAHEYTLVMDDGTEQVIPSVTQIASKVTGKDLSKIPQKILKAAGERGTKIHKAVQDGADCGDESYWIEQQIDREKCAFEQQSFAEADGLYFAGTADIVSPDTIYDIKSQAKADIPYWTVQLNLYRQFYDGITSLKVLWVPKAEVFRVINIRVLSDKEIATIIDCFKAGKELPAGFFEASPDEKPEAPSLELVVYKNNLGELTTNARAIMESVKLQLSGYKAENYTEANIADAKRDKAELNAASKKLNDKRIELEREFMKPFLDFKDTIAETCGLIKDASGKIDLVVKEVEQRERDQKMEKIEAHWSGLDFKLFPLSQIFNPSWLNKGTKFDDITDQIAAKIAKVRSDLVVLDRINEPEAKAHYLSSLDLESALAEVDRIKASRARLAEAEKQRDAPVPVIAPSIKELEEELVAEPELLERTFRVRCTIEQLVALSQYLNTNAIAFEKL